MNKSYGTIRDIFGSFIVVTGANDAKKGAMAVIESSDRKKRIGYVSHSNGENTYVCTFDSLLGVGLIDSTIQFMNHGITVQASPDMTGRMFDGIGRPIDSIAGMLPRCEPEIRHKPISPTERVIDTDIIKTGIKPIDENAAIHYGDHCAILGDGIKPACELACEIGVRFLKDDNNRILITALVGLPERIADYAVSAPGDNRVRTIVFRADSNESCANRALLPHTAATIAEYFANELDKDVMLMICDMKAYANAHRESLSMLRENAGKYGYPLDMRSDIASITERAGKLRGKKGSLTILTVTTADEIAHPVSEAVRDMADVSVVVGKDGIDERHVKTRRA